MYFRVSQAPSLCYGLVCAMCFQDLLQQLELRLIYTYCTCSHRQAIYFLKAGFTKLLVELPNITEGLVAKLMSSRCFYFKSV